MRLQIKSEGDNRISWYWHQSNHFNLE